MPFYAIPQYHISIYVINNTLSSVKMKSVLFFPKRESFINYVWSPNTFFFTNVTSNYTFWNINLSIQTHKVWSNYFSTYLIVVKSSQTGYLKGPVIGTFGVLFLSIALLWGRSKHKEGKLRKKKMKGKAWALLWKKLVYLKREDQLVHTEQLPRHTNTIYNCAKCQNIIVIGGYRKKTHI